MKGKLTDSDVVLDWLMEQDNVMPRLNSRVLSSAAAQLDLTENVGEFSHRIHLRARHRPFERNYFFFTKNQELPFFASKLMHKAYQATWQVVIQLLLVSHGQATVERGFSRNNV